MTRRLWTRVAVAALSAVLLGAAPGRSSGWTPGNAYRYHLRWSAGGVQGWLRERGGNAAAFSSELDADLVLTALPPGPGGGARLVARFENVRRLGLSAFGTPLFAGAAAAAQELTRESAVLELGAGDQPLAAAFTGSDHSLFALLLRGAWRSVGWSPPSAGEPAAWTASEPGPSGHAFVQYERDPAGARLRRTRIRYESFATVPVNSPEAGLEARLPVRLDSHTTFTFGAEGALQQVEDREALTVSPVDEAPTEGWTRLDLQLVERREVPAPLPPGGAVHPLDEVAGSLALDRRLLEQRVAGLTPERMEVDLTIHQGAGRIPDQGRWVWRASGLLLLEPALAARLLDRALAAQALPRTRALIFDLWASAGTVEAQAAMRAALAALALTSPEEEHGLLVTRLGFLRRPEPETVRFTRALADDAQMPSYSRRAAVGVLGSLVRSLAPTRPEEARAQHRRLLAGLRAAGTAEDRVAHLIGLGNAGVEGDAPALAPFADDPSPAVRSQVPWSLRSMPSVESREVLLRLLRSPGDDTVQIAALRRLASYPLGDAELVVLERLVRSGALAAAAAGELLGVLEGQSAPRAQVILELLARQPDLSPGVRNRAQRARQAMVAGRTVASQEPEPTLVPPSHLPTARR
ncbi:MAG TPA: HEAT repeat domain-containing protein [Myxococcaceae bacterium]|jgi:hypothetical protein